MNISWDATSKKKIKSAHSMRKLSIGTSDNLTIRRDGAAGVKAKVRM
jgi:hypothetical protein